MVMEHQEEGLAETEGFEPKGPASPDRQCAMRRENARRSA